MYLPDFLDSFDRLVAFDAETTGKRAPDAEFIRKQPFAWRAPGIIIEVGFVELLREGEGWRKGEMWSSGVNPDGPIDPDGPHAERPTCRSMTAPMGHVSRQASIVPPVRKGKSQEDPAKPNCHGHNRMIPRQLRLLNRAQSGVRLD